MKIDENEVIGVWLAGNTGLRNPMRIHDGFIAFSQSPYVENLHGNENELGFMKFLDEREIINNEEGKDTSGSHARKWRLMFERYGFIYGQVKKNSGFEQEDLGKMDDITPFGRIFIRAQTVPDMQECFLRSLAVEQYWLPDESAHYSPFRWVLAIMLELEKRTGSSELSRLEFGLWAQTTNPSYDVGDVVDHILDLRDRRKAARAKRPFDKQEILERGEHYDRKSSNFLDYSDMNMRYLRMSGVLQRKGRGLMIVPTKHVIAEALAKTTASTEPMIDVIKTLTNGAPLPTDDIKVAKKVLNELMRQMKEQNIYFDISGMPLDTPTDVNMARRYLENLMSQTDEINYAAIQKDKWQEISDYMSLLIKGGGKKEYDDDYVIEVPKEEAAAYLEWVLWRAALAISHLVNKPYEVRGFELDSDFMPINAAGGGKGDLYWEFKDFTILTEVTMSSGSRQESMEGEPVRRHVSDAVLKYDKPVYGLFVAVRIDTNTAETFRHGVWYAKDDMKQRLNIVPVTLAQFQIFFERMFQNNKAEPEELVRMIDYCTRSRDRMEAPVWKSYIDSTLRLGTYAKKLTELENKKKSETDFPCGIYVGSRVKNLLKDKVGIVVGIREDLILVIFDGDDLPLRPVAINEEGFTKGFYALA